MLNSLKPPTDNLYKFIAIFGLLLLGLSIWLGQQEWERYSEARFLAYEAYQQAWVEADESEKLRDLLDQVIDDLYSGNKLIYTFSDLLQEMEGIEVETIEAVRRFEIECTRILFISGRTESRTRLGGALFVIGIALIICGFVFWYFRVQYYEDCYLKNRRIISEEELRSTELSNQALELKLGIAEGGTDKP
jgi:hypothetical protein